MDNNETRGDVNSTDTTREEFLTKPIGGLMVKNILPAISSMLFMILYQMIDGILVGRRLGPEALASVNILFPVFALISGLAIMIGVGGNAKIAILLGKAETTKARSILSLVTTIGISIGILSSMLIFATNKKILGLLGTSGPLGIYAGEYLNVLHYFLTPMILIFILEHSVRNDGRPNLATGVMASISVLNIVLDYLFLFKLNMGIRGAALATGISQTLGAIIFLNYFIKKTMSKESGLSFGDIRYHKREIISISLNGSSELFNSIALGLTTFLYNRLIINYAGPMGVAAFALVQYFLMVGIAVFTGMANGCQPIISYNYGGGQSDRVEGTLKRLLGSTTIISLIIFIFIKWQIESLVGIFIPNQLDAIKFTSQVANYICWSILFMPVGIIGSVYFTALEEHGNSLVVAVSRSFIFTIIGLLLFPLMWGEIGIWITPIFSEGLTAFITVALIYKWMKKNSEILV